MRVRCGAGLFTCLLGLAFVLPTAMPAASAGEPDDGGGIEAAQQRKIDLEALAEERKARAALEQNRPRARVQRYLNAIVEATEEGEPGEAAELVARIEKAQLNPQERALVARIKGFVLYSEGDVEGAIEAFESALAEEILSLDDEVRLRFNIAQLYASLQKWPETIEALHAWFPFVQEPDPLAYYLLAVSHFQLDQFDEALEYAEKAVDAAPEPKEGWLQLLAALYVQKESYASAQPVLEELMMRFPKKLYWVQLSLIYGARENYKHSLAVQQIAYAQGLLVEDKELRRLARSYLFAELPFEAARVLEKGIADGRIEADAEVYEMLANSWIAAREYDRSLEPLRKAAALSEDGELYVRLGQVHIQREEWSQAVEMLQRALDKGGLEKRGQAMLLLGISYYNDAKVSQARQSFARAARDEGSKAQAEAWLKHLEAEASQAAGAQPGEAPPEAAGPA